MLPALIHHVTALAGDPAENVRFYAGVLGLRLVKRTVNFDDMGTYHLYFGDRIGRPGTLMTFFPHPHARRGAAGSSEVSRTIFAAPAGSLPRWRSHLAAAGVDVSDAEGFGEPRLEFVDPHGTRLGIAAVAGAGGRASDADGMALRGIDGVVIDVPDAAATAEFIASHLGFADGGAERDRRLLVAGGASGAGGRALGGRVEVVTNHDAPAGLGAGSVHHVAWRAADDAAQRAMGARLAADGFGVTGVRDRMYFRSIYFREPGGVIFEIATDGPGFLVDESEAALGTELKLPAAYEPHRARIAAQLRPLPVAAGGRA